MSRPRVDGRIYGLVCALLLVLWGAPGKGETVGGPKTVGAPIQFQRVDAAWGIDFQHRSGASGRYYMVETNGGGVVVFDYDGDGDLDLFFANGAALPGYGGETPKSRLYRNDRVSTEPGRFVDVTDRAQLAVDGYASGGVAGDVDGDGDLDLYVTAFGPNRLFLNGGDGTFREVGEAAGVDDPSWGSSAALADVDRDGDLDLYVTNYVDFTLDNNKACGDSRRGLRGYCGPDVYRGQGDRFYRNRGDGTFEDATVESGFGQASGAGLAVAFGDFDGDGWVDLYVANDLTPNFLWVNRGPNADGAFTFEDRALLAGVAHGPRGQAEAGMGVALGDFDGDARTDVVVTNYEGESQALYAQRGPWLFTDRRFVAGLVEPTLRKLAFGVAAADFDHDGDLDLAFANGHVRENAEAFNRASRYRQPNQLFENRGGRFVEADAGLTHLAASRGLAVGDLDLDGDLDLVITNVDEGPEVYENLTDGPWLQVDVRGTASGVPPSGLGAQVTVTGWGNQRRELSAGASYMSQHASSAHFGAVAPEPTAVEIQLPNGRVQTVRKVPAGRRLIWILGD